MSNCVSLLNVSLTNCSVSLNILCNRSTLLLLLLCAVVVVMICILLFFRNCITSGLINKACALSLTIFLGMLNMANVCLRQFMTVSDCWSFVGYDISRLENKSIILKAAVIFFPLKVCSCLNTIKSTIHTSFGACGRGTLFSGKFRLLMFLWKRHDLQPVQMSFTYPCVDPSMHLYVLVNK